MISPDTRITAKTFGGMLVPVCESARHTEHDGLTCEEADTLIRITIHDEAFPVLTATFTYALTPDGRLSCVGFGIDSQSPAEPVTASQVRDFPLARWDRTARAAAVKQLAEGAGEDPPPPLATWAEALVNGKFPELNPPKDGHEVRRRNSLLHLAEAAEEYARIAATGERNPAGVLAERRGTTSATVRGWLHRARREGLALPSDHPNANSARQGPVCA